MGSKCRLLRHACGQNEITEVYYLLDNKLSVIPTVGLYSHCWELKPNYPAPLYRHCVGGLDFTGDLEVSSHTCSFVPTGYIYRQYDRPDSMSAMVSSSLWPNSHMAGSTSHRSVLAKYRRRRMTSRKRRGLIYID